MSKTILFVHQSAELYGSDKTLFYLAKSIEEFPDYNTIVVLPNEGPLKSLLEDNNIKVIVHPVIKLSRSMFSLIGFLKLPFLIIYSVISLKNKLKGVSLDLIHSNTLAVLLGAFYAKAYNVKHLWHVHEIIKKPKIVSKVYPWIVNRFSEVVIFNSKASKNYLSAKNSRLAAKSKIILNGLDRPEMNNNSVPTALRKKLFDFEEDTIILGLVGRISKWKGQGLLLEAFENLQDRHNKLRLVFVGSAPPGQDHLVEDLKIDIEKKGLNKKCEIVAFTDNIWEIWDSIDCAVVPSTEPEPFGLVAVEAMLAKKPVVAASHGGLLEIVEEQKSGLFFEPKNTKDLEKKLDILISNKAQMETFGEYGYKRAIKNFSLKNYTSKFMSVYYELLK